MDKKYISFDIESTGPTPGRYSMIAIGACIVGDTPVQFYREIRPLNMNLVPEAMKVSALGLRCLDKSDDELNPKSERFNPGKVLEALAKKGDSPEKVMADYAEWIKANTAGFRPVEAAAPIKFDGMFTAWYFDNFYSGENPFGHSGEDMNSVYRGVRKDINASMRDLNMRGKSGLLHNALDDAVQQALEFEKVMELMRRG